MCYHSTDNHFIKQVISKSGVMIQMGGTIVVSNAFNCGYIVLLSLEDLMHWKLKGCCK